MDPTCPGAGDDAHRGSAVVTPGITSTGDLTPGLDRNHGNTGDFWWLDTKRGHSYRIQVKFGDGQRNNTGGSAWTYFIEGDRRGTCCESDHNRDDGFTFVHLKHGEDDRDRRYLIDVAAFDKLNHSSRVYNGPYTITMTDITGTDKVATNLYLGTRAKSTLPSVANNIKYAVPFTTGGHLAGYKLDRVRMHVPYHEGLPDLVLHADMSGLPGDGICDLLEPNKVQHHPPYAADNQLPVLFRAAHCGRDAVLDASTTYWLVLAGDEYSTVFTDSHDQQTDGSGWSIGNRAATKILTDWELVAGVQGTIPVEIWASPAPPPNRQAAGVPLIDGERRVGKTLTADITGITDPEGLSDPRFTYSWIRGDGVDEESITGEESDTYVLTDDDAGKRIRTLVTFYDDDEQQETAVGPATSLIMPAAAAQTLVSNFTGGTVTGTIGGETTRSTGFVTGSHELGYVIDDITTYRGVLGTLGDGDAEIQVYDSTSDTNPLSRKPDDLVMTANDFIRVNGYIVAYGAESRVKLDPNTTYHISMVSLIGKPPGCRTASQDAIDDDSLEGFSIIYRTYAIVSPRYGDG